MEQLTFLNLFLFTLGLVVNIVFEAQRTRQQGKPLLSVDVLLNIILSLASGLALLIFGPDILISLGLQVPDNNAMFFKIHAFVICGILPLPVIRRLIAMWGGALTVSKKIINNNTGT